jgi:hypothetical protein
MKEEQKISPSWEALIHRSRTDTAFRTSLLGDPTRVLRDAGLIRPGDTAVVREWSATEHLVVLPPPLRPDEKPGREGSPGSGAPHVDRAPYSTSPCSSPMVGPGASRLSRPVSDA